MICVFGAGAIGCYVGGRLAAGGADVTLIGRSRVMDEAGKGLTLTELDGTITRVRVKVTTDPSVAKDAQVVLVTVKSAATEEAGTTLASIVPSSCTTVSLQNGIRNAAMLRDAMPGKRVLAGMVMYNVARRGPGEYHRGTIGSLMVERDDTARPFVDACAAAKLALDERDDMPAVQWSKLVMNLNNAINALSGKPLAEELGDRMYRRCLSAAMHEALDLLARAKEPVAKLTVLPPRWMARMLPIPNALFSRLARRVVAVDPHARSSMADDFAANRPTEIDYIQGAVTDLATRLGTTAPVNAKLVELVHAAESGGKREWSSAELAQALGVR